MHQHEDQTTGVEDQRHGRAVRDPLDQVSEPKAKKDLKGSDMDLTGSEEKAEKDKARLNAFKKAALRVNQLLGLELLEYKQMLKSKIDKNKNMVFLYKIKDIGKLFKCMTSQRKLLVKTINVVDDNPGSFNEGPCRTILNEARKVLRNYVEVTDDTIKSMNG